MVGKCGVNIDTGAYETEVKANFIVVSSLCDLHRGTRKYFEEVTSLKGRNMDKQGVDI
jgi:hypothetical protein